MTKDELKVKSIEDLRIIARACGLMDVEDYDKEALIAKLADSDDTAANDDAKQQTFDKQNGAAGAARDILDKIKAQKAGMTLEEYRNKQNTNNQEQQEKQEQNKPAVDANEAARLILDKIKAQKAGLTLEEYQRRQRR